MNNIQFHIQFKKDCTEEWICRIAKQNEFIETAIENYVHSDIHGFTLECKGKLLSGAKTISQLGYLHAEILVKALRGYKSAGWIINNTEQAKDLLKDQIGFYEIIKNPKTGKTKKSYLSFAKASKEDTRLAIDAMIIFIQTDLGISVETPKEYKERMGIKEFSK